MEDGKESEGWMSVPTFGEWDMKNGVPDYSLDFTKIREMKKQNKARASLGNEDELLHSNTTATTNSNIIITNDHDVHIKKLSQDEPEDNHHHHHTSSPTGRKRFMNYFQCCIRA